MNIISTPTTLEKLQILGDTTEHEPAGDQPHSERAPRRAPNIPPCISEVSTPSGLKPIMKTMLTTACERNCQYCIFRAGRGKTRRTTVKPDEMAAAFNQYQSAGLADGMFLSSGMIKGGVTTQDKILDTVDIIRTKYHYRGYVHLKIMPGAEYDYS
jgi:predicted DNA-binding helix-hairpin-helix protein